MIVLVIPVTALALAMIWVRWMRRPDKPLDPVSQVEAAQRGLDALAHSATGVRRRRTGQTRRTRERISH